MNAVDAASHRIVLLENGEAFFPRVVEAIAQAHRSIYLETFILGEDCVGRDLHGALVAAARRGVEVDLLVDGFGSGLLSEEYCGSLREAGIRLHVFEPRRRIFGVRTNLFRRMHRKITIIDARIAFVGGINYCEEQLVEKSPEALHDFAVEIEGPVVADIVRFVESSDTAAEIRPLGRRARRARARREAEARDRSGRVRFVTRDNDLHRSDIEREYRRAIAAATREVTIANAYFFPGYRLLRELRLAARRGVAVTVIVQGRPDMKIVSVLARWLYHYLVPRGVRVLEYCARPMHAKVATVDGRWSTIGSSNLDPLSLALNLEANLVIEDEQFARELSQALQNLIAAGCREVTSDKLPSATPWRMALVWVVFHFLRHFPTWAGWMPAHRPRIAAPITEACAGHDQTRAPDAKAIGPEGGHVAHEPEPVATRAAADLRHDAGPARTRDDAALEPGEGGAQERGVGLVATRESGASPDGDAARGSEARGRRRLVAAWRRWRHAISIGFAALVVVLLARAALGIDWSAVGDAIGSRSPGLLALALAAAAASHALYGLLDVIGRPFARHRLDRLRTWATATCAYALSLNLGGLVGGLGLRIRLYGRQGVDAGAATRTAFASISGNWIGCLALLATAPAWADAAAAGRWSAWIGSWWLAAGCAGIVATWLVLCARGVAPSWRGRSFALPSLRVAGRQCLVAAANWALMAAVLKLCLPAAVGYDEALATLLIAAAAGALTHVPAGIGVLEFVAVSLLGAHAPAEVIAGVLCYRALYYLLPLAFALLVYAWRELRPRTAPHGATSGAQAAPAARDPGHAPAKREDNGRDAGQRAGAQCIARARMPASTAVLAPVALAANLPRPSP